VCCPYGTWFCVGSLIRYSCCIHAISMGRQYCFSAISVLYHCYISAISVLYRIGSTGLFLE